MNVKKPDGAEHYSSSAELERARFRARLRSLVPSGSESRVARAAGISQSGLRGALAHGNPGRDVLVKIAGALGVSVSWLATGSRDEVEEENARYCRAERPLSLSELAPDPVVLVRVMGSVTRLSAGASEAECVDAVLWALRIMNMVLGHELPADALPAEDYDPLADAVLRLLRASKSNPRKQG